MASSQCSDEGLNESWEELQFQQHRAEMSSPALGKPQTHPITHHTMEKLLLEAQREFSASSSRVGSATSTAASSTGSPTSPDSPPGETVSLGLLQEVSSFKVKEPVPQRQGTDWIWEWSSRPEAQPMSSEWGSKMKHPRQHSLSKSRGGGQRGLLHNIPLLILTHACSFFLGAAAMLLLLKKYYNWAAVVPPTVD